MSNKRKKNSCEVKSEKFIALKKPRRSLSRSDREEDAYSVLKMRVKEMIAQNMETKWPMS